VLGTLLLVWWLLAAASGPGAFAAVQWFLGSWLGILLLFGWTWALMYHLANGIRHLMWDTVTGLDLPVVYLSGRIALVASVVLTLLVWLVALLVM
jgi:succinate dehydrogenase / fumarate reductase cytochrome b subunit